jgi:FkbM family methyltransferase
MIQSVSLYLYRQVRRTGILSTPFGRAIFETAYYAYKATVEARDVRLLRQFVVVDQTIIDVGANIGFFTLKFARWLNNEGRVIAIEPEEKNFSRLVYRLERAQLQSRVQAILAAAAEAAGELHLAINPDHPADHCLSDHGVSVQAVTLDALVAAAGDRPVCLIKIDVQGAEPRVLAGARLILGRFKPAVFLEIDESGLSRAGRCIDDVLRPMRSAGYLCCMFVNGGISAPMSDLAVAHTVRQKGSQDFLFIHRDRIQP